MKIGVTGYKGRVGRLLVEEIETHQAIEFAGGIEKGDDADTLFKKADAVIDFTSPLATRKYAWLASKYKTAFVVGTTGLSVEDEGELEEAAKETPIVYAANMSVGVNILLALVEEAASRLAEDWDIEIFEAHHKHKVDAPSGTALALGRAAAKGRETDLDDVKAIDRNGKRKTGDIGFSVARGGDVVGEHRVFFYGAGERVELSHVATNRALFATGAIKAAMWARDQKPGLYAMRDVLGIA